MANDDKTPDPGVTLEALEAAAAQLIIELAFLVPKGTNLNEHPVGQKLEAYRQAIVNRALARRASLPTAQELETLALAVEHWIDAHAGDAETLRDDLRSVWRTIQRLRAASRSIPATTQEGAEHGKSEPPVRAAQDSQCADDRTHRAAGGGSDSDAIALLARAYANGFLTESRANLDDPAEIQTRDEIERLLIRFTEEVLAVRVSPPPQTWQPIETAPVCGPPVVLWGRIWRQPFVGIVLPEAMGNNCYLDGKDGQGMHARATHWMPLPLAPETPEP